MDTSLDGDRRDEILRAVAAIERQVSKVVGNVEWQALWVIQMNLGIIRSQVTIAPRASSN